MRHVRSANVLPSVEVVADTADVAATETTPDASVFAKNGISLQRDETNMEIRNRSPYRAHLCLSSASSDRPFIAPEAELFMNGLHSWALAKHPTLEACTLTIELLEHWFTLSGRQAAPNGRMQRRLTKRRANFQQSMTITAQSLQLWHDGMNKHAKACSTNVEANCDSEYFLQAKTELGTSATIRAVAKRAQELRNKHWNP
jgi:hypothetical protein